MHVTLVTPAYPPLPGGGERYVGALARGLVARGIRVTVITSGAREEAHFWDGVHIGINDDEETLCVDRLPIRHFPGGRRGLMLYRKAMVMLSAAPGDHTRRLMVMARRMPSIVGMEEELAMLVSEGVDLIHAFNISWERGLAAAYSAAVPGIPLVVTPFAHLGEAHRDRVARNSTMQHQLKILREAQRVLVLTDVERRGLAGYGVPAERIAVVGGAVDLPPAELTGSPYWLPSGRAWSDPYAVFVGRLSFDKGAIHAAQAILRLPAGGPALVLIGSMTPEFDRFYRGLAPEEQARVYRLGVLSDRDKHAIIARARCLLLPSRSDSFGIVILEAWSHGVPVIAARAGGIPGVVDEGENGLFVSFGDVAGLADAVGELVRDQSLAKRLGESGRQKIARAYNWDAVTERVLSVYREVL